MRRPLTTAAALVLVLAAAPGCADDFLSVTNPNELSQDTYWKTEADALQGLTAVYGQLQSTDRWSWFEMQYTGLNYRADDVRATRLDLPFAAALASFTYSTDNVAIQTIWSDYYRGVFYANQVIENVPGIEMDPARRDQIVGEAKFLRGYYYFVLLNTFRNVPLILETPEGSEDYTPAQATPDDVWAQIEADFRDAAAVLPATPWPAQFAGRVTKGTAQAYLGKAHLFQEQWAEAASAFEAVINGGGYALLDEFADNFNGSHENGAESLFEIQHSAARPNNVTESTPLIPEQAPFALGGWEEFFPSDWLMDLMRTDVTADGEPTERVLATVFFDHPRSEMLGTPYAEVEGDLGPEKVFFKKYAYDNDLSGAGQTTRSGINVHLMRYADLLLMHAEALNELGRTGEAASYVNRVRERSGAVPIGAMGQAELRQHIRHVERPLELAMEFTIRWFDLVRWGDVRQTLAEHRKPDAANFQSGRHEYLPIPLSEINVNPSLQQNPGY